MRMSLRNWFKNITPLNKALLTLIAAALVIIFFGSAVGLTKNNPSEDFRQADPEPQKVINYSAKKNEKIAAYTELGEIRAVCKAPSEDEKGTIVLIRPWFSYPDGDTVLFEELSDKSRKLKVIFSDYFASHTEDELTLLGETKIKQDLCHLINAELVLGKITAVYFDAYIFF